MATPLETLEEQVTRTTTVATSAITLLNGLSAEIVKLKNDPVKLQAFADSLKSSADAMAEAIVANTPAAP